MYYSGINGVILLFYDNSISLPFHPPIIPPIPSARFTRFMPITARNSHKTPETTLTTPNGVDGANTNNPSTDNNSD